MAGFRADYAYSCTYSKPCAYVEQLFEAEPTLWLRICLKFKGNPRAVD